MLTQMHILVKPLHLTFQELPSLKQILELMTITTCTISHCHAVSISYRQERNLHQCREITPLQVPQLQQWHLVGRRFPVSPKLCYRKEESMQNCVDNEVPEKSPPCLEAQIFNKVPLKLPPRLQAQIFNQRSSIGAAGDINNSSGRNIGDLEQHNSVSPENIDTDAYPHETSPFDVSGASQLKTNSGTNDYYNLHLKPLPCRKYLLPTRKKSTSVSRNDSFASCSAAAVAFSWEEVPGKPKLCYRTEESMQNCVDNEVPEKLPSRLEAQIFNDLPLKLPPRLQGHIFNQRSSIGVAGNIDDTSGNIGDLEQHNSVSPENINTDAHDRESSPSDVSGDSRLKTKVSRTNGYHYLHLKPLQRRRYLLPTRKKLSTSVSRDDSFASSSAAAVAFSWEEVPGKPKLCYRGEESMQNCVDNEVPENLAPRLEAQIFNDVPLKLPPRLQAQIFNQRSAIGPAAKQAEKMQAMKSIGRKIFNCLPFRLG
ncbi:hypothetical protein O6H91_04G105900 [Diphasiastrum complanatum]|uniref:Uncharacterized protein n=1 Tax=Diphasiastrum complanatum TaxID=34168 RepID=A0ACC2E070_DIPCM|nr:hypothetical protein O6H91_04G105900 [Diphasiastrum complanatum]